MTITARVVKSPNLARYDRIAKQRVRRAIAAGGQAVRNTAVKSINQTSTGGTTVQKYNPRRQHITSGPNRPPNTDTGYLASNIFLTFENSGMSAQITSRAKYSAALEYGSLRNNLKPRPFMVPALEENRKKIAQLIKRALSGLQRGGGK